MPLFQRTKTALNTVEQTNFDTEKALQHLIEQNLENDPMFRRRFTGGTHGRSGSLLWSGHRGAANAMSEKWVENGKTVTRNDNTTDNHLS